MIKRLSIPVNYLFLELDANSQAQPGGTNTKSGLFFLSFWAVGDLDIIKLT